MAPPLLIVIESDSDTDIEDLHFRPRDLKFKSLEQRHSFYRQNFSNTTIRLQDFKLPALCHQAPSLAPEIIEAYLARTTVVVNVWTNYDTAYKRFFADRRIEDCGVIQLSPSASTKLVDMGIADYQFQTVVFEVGTAFRLLARVQVKVKRVNGVYTLRCILTDGIENHDKFRGELARVVQRLDHIELPPKWAGLNVNNIQDLAALFRWDINPHSSLEEDLPVFQWGRTKTYFPDWCMSDAELELDFSGYLW